MTNEDLAFSILRHDPKAREWVFNYYCSSCARFLYPEDLANGTCKKCKAPTDTKIGQAIPFLTSSTALEKLITWIKDRKKSDKRYAVLQQIALGEVTHWIMGESYQAITAAAYRKNLVTKITEQLTILDSPV